MRKLPRSNTFAASQISQKDLDNKFKKGETPWPKQKYSVALACVARCRQTAL
jgi:hypothetical protein